MVWSVAMNVSTGLESLICELVAIESVNPDIAASGGGETAVADEEVASLGTSAVLEKFRADFGIVTEPTELQLCLAHKGFVWLEVETHGVAAHGSRSDLGVDAIAHMGRVLTGVLDLDSRLREGPRHRLLGAEIGRAH